MNPVDSSHTLRGTITLDQHRGVPPCTIQCHYKGDNPLYTHGIVPMIRGIHGNTYSQELTCLYIPETETYQLKTPVHRFPAVSNKEADPEDGSWAIHIDFPRVREGILDINNVYESGIELWFDKPMEPYLQHSMDQVNSYLTGGQGNMRCISAAYERDTLLDKGGHFLANFVLEPTADGYKDTYDGI